MLHKKEEKSPYRLDPPKKMHRAKQAVLSQNQTSQVKHTVIFLPLNCQFNATELVKVDW